MRKIAISMFAFASLGLALQAAAQGYDAGATQTQSPTNYSRGVVGQQSTNGYGHLTNNGPRQDAQAQAPDVTTVPAAQSAPPGDVPLQNTPRVVRVAPVDPAYPHRSPAKHYNWL